MKKLKYVKLFEEFKINESFVDNNFYHISFKNLLDPFKKGVDYKKIDSSDSSKSQGGGLYLFSEEDKMSILLQKSSLLTKQAIEILSLLPTNLKYDNLILFINYHFDKIKNILLRRL